jgi:hypothetical protein
MSARSFRSGDSQTEIAAVGRGSAHGDPTNMHGVTASFLPFGTLLGPFWVLAPEGLKDFCMPALEKALLWAPLFCFRLTMDGGLDLKSDESPDFYVFREFPHF